MITDNDWEIIKKRGGILVFIIMVILAIVMYLFHKFSYICLTPKYCY